MVWSLVTRLREEQEASAAQFTRTPEWQLVAIGLVVVGALYLGGFGASIFRIAMLGIVVVTGTRG